MYEMYRYLPISKVLSLHAFSFFLIFFFAENSYFIENKKSEGKV